MRIDKKKFGVFVLIHVRTDSENIRPICDGAVPPLVDLTWNHPGIMFGGGHYSVDWTTGLTVDLN